MKPSGKNYAIRGRVLGQQAKVTVAQVAAALRGFKIDGVDVVPRYPRAAIPSMGSGVVMVPWPNRVADGAWKADGVVHQLDVSEVDKRNALHGLLRYTAYTVLERDDAAITLGANIHTANDYPYVLQTSVRYGLSDSGLIVEHEIRNRSDVAAPVAIGTHPYFQIGDVPTEDLVLTSPAEQVYAHDERCLPVRKDAVSGLLDLRHGARVRDLALDHCFTGLAPAGERSTTTLTAPDGRSVAVWADADFAYQVLLVTDSFVDHTGVEVRAVAIEPQTAAVNAFNTGDGLRWLRPGERWTLRWGVIPDLRRDLEAADPAPTKGHVHPQDSRT
jgi:aldose 1-epimerase